MTHEAIEQREGMVVTQADTTAARQWLSAAVASGLIEADKVKRLPVVELLATHRHQSTISLEEERDALAKRVARLEEFVRLVSDMKGDELDAHASPELRDAARAALNTDPSHAE